MRIQNINQYQGGANDVVAREYVNGTKQTQLVTISTGPAGSTTPFDLSGASFQLDVVFATASSTSSRSGININTLSQVANDQSFRTADGNTDTMVALPGKDISSSVTVANATQGQLNIAWPLNLYEGYVPFNTDTNTPVAVATLRIADGSSESSAANVYSVRFLLFVRFGAIVS